MNQNILRTLSRLVSEPGDTEEWQIKKTIGMLTAFIGMLTQLGYGLLFFLHEEFPAAYLMFVGAVLFLLGIVSFSIWRHYYAHGYYWLLLAIVTPSGGTILLGGINQAGFLVIWIMVAPLMALIAHKPSDCPYWFIVTIISIAGIGFLQPVLRSSNNLPTQIINVVMVFNVTAFFALMFFVLNHHIGQNRKLSQLVRDERDKSDALLLNILPKEIAAILKNENRVIADHFDSVSILFADVVNFTAMSAEMAPKDLVAMLNEVFSQIDLLVAQYDLEKIKTIGDCYMVASGVPSPRADHAVALTQLALDINNVVNGRQFQGKQLIFRFGINSGPVVAGVIGSKKFIYDLWGDAVNIASRMETNGSASCIQITAATHDLIRHDFLCEFKGQMSIKGKGQIPVWHVLGKKI